uniref:Uncharacterized protein n=1 Tax=Oryza meridionalis TaxID=40149 RepID=A0A0E0EMH3_9ORYZ
MVAGVFAKVKMGNWQQGKPFMHTQGSKSKGRTEDGRRDASSLCPGLSGRGMEHGKEGEDRTRIHPGCAGDKLGRTVAACQPWQGRGREDARDKRLGWYGRRPVAARSWGPWDVTALTSERCSSSPLA